MPARGIENVRRNFHAKVKEISYGRTEAALYAILSQGQAMAATMTPIDTSNLINSAYAPQISVEQGFATGHVGYTAEYAAAVHEAPGTLLGTNTPRDSNDPSRGNVWDPNAEPEFLRKGFDEIMPQIPRILRSVYNAR